MFSSHVARARSYPFGVGPGFSTRCGCSVPPLRGGPRHAAIKEIKRLRGGCLVAAIKANMYTAPEIAPKDYFQMETTYDRRILL